MNLHLRFLFALAAALSPLLAQTSPPASTAKPPVLPGARVTVLVDNLAGGGPLLGEWGAAFLVETNGHRILFDTGGGQVILGNAKALGVNFRPLDAIVLSHGHEDHTSGLDKVLALSGPVRLFVHPVAFATHYWKENARVEPYSMPVTRAQLAQQGATIIETKEPTAVCPGVMVTGEIPRNSAFENTGVQAFAFLDSEGKVPDLILDDQALCFRVPEGVVVVLGCGHAGLVNTLEHVCRLLGESTIHAVIGGTHLLKASPERTAQTLAGLRRFRVQKILLSHCTGHEAQAAFRTAFPGRCDWPASGTRVDFGINTP